MLQNKKNSFHRPERFCWEGTSGTGGTFSEHAFATNAIDVNNLRELTQKYIISSNRNYYNGRDKYSCERKQNRVKSVNQS
jgi:uncharacterized membrane protein